MAWALLSFSVSPGRGWKAAVGSGASGGAWAAHPHIHTSAAHQQQGWRRRGDTRKYYYEYYEYYDGEHLQGMWLQTRPRMVTASAAYGYSLGYPWLEVRGEAVAASAVRALAAHSPPLTPAGQGVTG